MLLTASSLAGEEAFVPLHDDVQMDRVTFPASLSFIGAAGVQDMINALVISSGTCLKIVLMVR